MREKEIFSINNMFNIEDEKFSVVLDHEYLDHRERIKKNIKIFGDEYLEKVYYITSKVLLEKDIFKNIKTYPSILCFSSGKETPDYFLPGVL